MHMRHQAAAENREMQKVCGTISHNVCYLLLCAKSSGIVRTCLDMDAAYGKVSGNVSMRVSWRKNFA